MIRKSWFATVGAFLLSFVLLTSAQGQDKKDPPKKDEAKKEEVLKLKRDITLLKKQNQLLEMRIKTLRKVLEFYRKRLQQSRDPLQNLQRQAQFILRQFQTAFMRKGIKGVIELFQKIMRQLKGRKKVSPLRRSNRSI